MPTSSLQQIDSGTMSGKDFAALFSAISPSFGSGTTTQRTDGGQDSNAARGVLGSILGGANGTDLDNMIQDIFNQAKQSFGPSAFAPAAAGAYNSTSQLQLQGDALARATAAAAKAKLDYTAQSQQTAATLAGHLAANNKTTTTKVGASPIGTALSAATGLLSANSLAKKITGKGVEDIFGNKKDGDLSSIPSDPLGGNDVIKNITDSFGSNQPGTLPDFSTVNDVTPGAADPSAFSLIDPSSNLIEAGGIGAGIDTGAASALIDTGGAEAAVNVGAGAALVDGGAAVAGDYLAADAAATVAGEAGISEAVLAAAAASSVVCYELVRTSGMSQELAKVSSDFAPRLPSAVLRGYHWMCPLLLKLMRKYPLFYKFMQKTATARSSELQSSNFFGKIVRLIGEPICFLLGHTFASKAPTVINIPEMLSA